MHRGWFECILLCCKYFTKWKKFLETFARLLLEYNWSHSPQISCFMLSISSNGNVKSINEKSLLRYIKTATRFSFSVEKNINFCGEGKFKFLKKTMINFFRLDSGITSRIKYSKIVINLSLMACESS